MIFFQKRKKNRGKVEKLINHYHKHICFALRTSKLVLLLLYKETQKFSFRRDHVKHYHVEKYADFFSHLTQTRRFEIDCNVERPQIKDDVNVKVNILCKGFYRGI